MALIDFINKFKPQKENKKYAAMLNGYSPLFSQFGSDIYASDVVQQAINCIVMEMKKLTPMHIRNNGSDPIPVYDSITRLLREPNERMTTSDFIEKIFWQLFLNYNAFIVPTYDVRFDRDGNKIKTYTGLYPIQPVNVDFLQDASGALFVRFKFLNDYETTLRYEDVIHIKYRFSVNEFMGGNQFGQPDNQALLKTLELNNILLEGVGKALKSSFSINGVVKYNTLLDDGKMDEAIKKLEAHLASNESGFLPLDIKGEFIPLQNKIELVDSETLKFIDEKILRYYGVSLPILTGNYTKAQYEAFYQKTLEPLIISVSQAFTKTLFTRREKDFGNEIKFYPHELIFMDSNQKLSLFDLLVDSGSCYKNELRTAFGMYPLPELAGQLAESSNKTNAENNRVGNELEQEQVDEQTVEKEERTIEKRYNPNHDGKTGRFTSKGGGGSGGSIFANSKAASKTGDINKLIENGKEIDSKQAVKEGLNEIKGGLGNNYSAFKKEPVNMSKVEERGGVKGEDAERCVQLAEEVYAKAEKNEPQITKDVVEAVSANNGEMFGLDYRMKQTTSMAGKIGADVVGGDMPSFEASANDVKDAIRYTAVFKTEDFVSGYNNVKSQMESKGYTEYRCKNFFADYESTGKGIKSVQSVFENKDGYKFEFQFQTYESQGVKELSHIFYDESRKATTSAKDRNELAKITANIYSAVPTPTNISAIKAHKR